MEHLIENTSLGFCILDLIPLIAIIALGIVFFVLRGKKRREEAELLERLAAYESALEEEDAQEKPEEE